MSTGARPGGVLLLVTLLTGPTACDDSSPRGLIPDSVYVQTLARLAVVDTSFAPGRRVMDDTPVDSARRLVLQERDVEPEELVEFADYWGRRPEKMHRLWERIRDLADSLRESGWRPAGPEASAQPP